MKGAFLPVLTVVIAIIGLWYLAAIPMNIKETLTEAERAGATSSGGTAAERRDACEQRHAGDGGKGGCHQRSDRHPVAGSGRGGRRRGRFGSHGAEQDSSP